MTAIYGNNAPKLVLMGRGQNVFYSTMIDIEQLQQWANDGTQWQHHAAATALPESQSEPIEKQAFTKTLAIAAKYRALVFQLSDDAPPREQMNTLAELYDVLLRRTLPAPRVIEQWQQRLWQTGILPYGQPYQPHSSYQPIVHALMPMLRGVKRR